MVRFSALSVVMVVVAVPHFSTAQFASWPSYSGKPTTVEKTIEVKTSYDGKANDLFGVRREEGGGPIAGSERCLIRQEIPFRSDLSRKQRRQRVLSVYAACQRETHETRLVDAFHKAM